MHPYRRSLAIAIVPGLLLAFAPAGLAQKPADTPDGQQLLRRMADLYRGASSFLSEATVQAPVAIQDHAEMVTMRYIFACSRPNKLALRQQTTLPSRTIVCDGRHLYAFQPAGLLYSRTPAPDSLASIEPRTLTKAGEGLGRIMTLLLRDDPYEAFVQGASPPEYVARETVAGSQAHHVRILERGWSIDLWIQATGKPALHKLSTSWPAPAAARPAQTTFSATFTGWTFDSPLPEETFHLSLPAGASLVEEGEMDFAAYGLKNKPAPALTLNLLEGGQVSLSRLKGKVVILDFWATWCPPCRKGLPILAEAAAQYKDMGVEFYAINNNESPAEIREFLEKEKLSIAVALNTDRSVSQRYKVKGIPQTVIVDRAGIVRAVHVGLPPDLKERMRRDLDAILAEKAPASQAKAAP